MTSDLTAPGGASVYSRKNPFLAPLVVHQRLTGPGSGKDTRHFVLSLAGSGVTYTPGDSIGIFARNPPRLVEEVLRLLNMDGEEAVTDLKGHASTFSQALIHSAVLNRSNKKVLTYIAERLAEGGAKDQFRAMLASHEAVAEFIHSRDFVDILREYPGVGFETPASFLSQLSPIQPRLYSIASSHRAHPGEVHLCVAIVRYETHGREKTGLATGFLADHAAIGRPDIPVYIQDTKSFRLPADPAADIIMCGPGTGIAPFRAFLEERTLDGATGRNWLFFGDQHRATDFLYGEELVAYQKAGALHRLDLAFSRDQEQKVYVQHRMRENAAELWRWLQSGAYFYVCGDARHMAKDVHQALIGIAETQGGLSHEAASDYVNVTLMKTEKRYLRDVY